MGVGKGLLRGLGAGVVAALAAAAVVALPPPPAAHAVGAPLTSAEVTAIVSRCVAFAKRVSGRPDLAVAVVDVEANSLGVFRMPGATDDAVGAALAKAGTGAYFSSDQQTFSTRTAAFIVQDHFPPGVRFQPAGPLYGVEFSSLGSSDVNRIFFPPDPMGRFAVEAEARVRGDLGGIGIYKNGRRVGGLGIDDADPKKRVTIPGSVFPGDDCRADYRLTFRAIAKGRDLERIVFAAARGRIAPRSIRADKITVSGIRLDYTLGSNLSAGSVPTVTPGVDGDWDAGYPLRDAAGIPSRFVDFTLDPPAGAGPHAQSFEGQVPLAFPVKDSTDGNLTAEDVSRILWQGAQRANITRAAIRRPIGLPMQCWICVVDTNGALLGAFRFQDDATMFSYDVAAQKARTAMFFSDDEAALSCRAVGLFAQGFYPAGQQGAGRGPLFQLQDGISVALLAGAFADVTAADLRITNGITIFPGGVPLYRGGKLVGGVGVSGDGVDQDDIVADFGSRGFGPPGSIRCDNLNGAQLKGAFRRALGRLEAVVPADPGNCDLPFSNKALSFFHARLAGARRTLERTELEVEPSYVKHPRHPGPVTIRNR